MVAWCLYWFVLEVWAFVLLLGVVFVVYVGLIRVLVCFFRWVLGWASLVSWFSCDMGLFSRLLVIALWLLWVFVFLGFGLLRLVWFSVCFVLGMLGLLLRDFGFTVGVKVVI